MKIEKYFDKQLQRECWRVDITVQNRRIRRGKFPTKAAVEKALAGLRMKLIAIEYGLPTPPVVITLRDLFDELDRQSTRTVQRLVLAMIRDVVDLAKPVQSLSRVDMTAFKAACVARGFKPGTIGHYRGTLYALLNRAGELFESLEEWQPPKFPAIDRIESRRRVLRQDELERICAHWRQLECFPRESAKWRDYRLELFDVLRMMLLTAARREEIERITESRIDWHHGWLNLRSGKVGRDHLIPLSSSALALLTKRKGREPLFPKFAASIPHYVCQRVAVASGIPYGQTADGWTLHDLRRTAATLVESSGIPYSVVAALLGHKRTDTTAIYTQANRDHLRRATDLLENYCREIDGLLTDLAAFQPTPRNKPFAKAQ